MEELSSEDLISFRSNISTCTDNNICVLFLFEKYAQMERIKALCN